MQKENLHEVNSAEGFIYGNSFAAKEMLKEKRIKFIERFKTSTAIKHDFFGLSSVVLLLLSVFSIGFAAAQPYSIKRLGIEQGLSNNYVVSIARDKAGFMWFATESGLNRFDGKEFKVYKKFFRSNSGISGNEQNKVLADDTDNVVWIATQRNGLNRFDCETASFSLFTHDVNDDNTISSNAITDLANDRAGNLWISTYEAGFDYYDKKKKKFTRYNQTTLPALKSNAVWTIADDGKGSLYIGHVSDGLSILSMKDRKVKNFMHEEENPYSLPGNEIHCIFIDNIQNIWIGTQNGLALFNPETERFTCFRNNKNKPNSLISNTIFSICQTADNRLWIGTENGGISILNIRKELFLTPENLSFHNIYRSDDDTGLSNPTVRCVFEDKFNNVWIGTYSGGINFIDKNPDLFHKWRYSMSPLKNSLTVETAWGMCEDNAGHIWVGTDGGGICEFDKGVRTAVYTKESGHLSDNAILCALKDSEGNLWFGSFSGGVMVRNSKNKKFTPFFPDLMGKQTVRCLFEDKDQTIWIGTDNGQMYAYHLPDRRLQSYTAGNEALPQDGLVRAIAQDAQGCLWIGSFGGGLRILDADLHFAASFGIAQGFYSNTVNCIFRDSQNRMWVGTGEGLIRFHDKDSIADFIIYSEKDGLQDSYVRAIAEDKYGNIWFSTNGGISKLAVAENKVYNYDSSSGVPSGLFMSGSVITDKNGVVYFGSQNGVCYFEPDRITGPGQLPPVTITGFRYHTGLFAPEDKESDYPVSSGYIRLKHNQNTFTITFNVMDYAFSHQVEYAYQLSGMSDEWYNTGQTNEVTFRNLPPGNYVFSVKAKANNRDWSSSTDSFRIKINPPLWLTLWAKSFYIVCIACIVFYTVRFYKKRIQLENLLYLEKQNSLQQQTLNNDKLQFFTNITHELRTPLTLIIGPLEDLSKDSSLSAGIEKKISLIHQNASRLLSLINKILDFRKTETNNMPLRVRKGDLAKLVKEIGLKYKELNQNPDLRITVSVETENTVLYFDPENVNIILDNLISNAFKYTAQGEIRVCLREVSENEVLFTEIEVSDTGIGIPPKERDKVFDRYYQVKGEHQASGTGIGLSLVKNLADIHQGTVRVESREEKGASFKFRLKTRNTYPGVFHEKADEETDYPSGTETADDREKSDKKTIILVIEDNPDILNYIWDAFVSDYSVLTAADGKKGLEYAFQNVPDIIISDIMMPETSGLELCSILKKDIRTSHIPIILLTAKTSLNDKTEGYSAGADSYITKPFSAGLLRSRVSNILESRKNLAVQLIHSKLYKQTLLSDSIDKQEIEFLEKITKIIEENSRSEDLDIEFIAERVNMSHSTLYRKIKALTGFTINEFIRKIKMKQAEELLLTGKYTVSEIAFRIGINSLAYFRQCFKEEFGSAPSEYVRKLNV